MRTGRPLLSASDITMRHGGEHQGVSVSDGGFYKDCNGVVGFRVNNIFNNNNNNNNNNNSSNDRNRPGLHKDVAKMLEFGLRVSLLRVRALGGSGPGSPGFRLGIWGSVFGFFRVRVEFRSPNRTLNLT